MSEVIMRLSLVHAALSLKKVLARRTSKFTLAVPKERCLQFSLEGLSAEKFNFANLKRL